MDMIEDAEDAGVITGEQYNDILQLDIIFSCRRRPDNVDAHVAGEVSITIGDSDVVRAARRAPLLSAAIGQPVIPAVIGANIDDARAALAAANNVSVVLIPDE